MRGYLKAAGTQTPTFSPSQHKGKNRKRMWLQLPAGIRLVMMMGRGIINKTGEPVLLGR